MFSLNLYNSLKSTDNLFFSPFSIRQALGKATVGARGQTLDELVRVLCLSTNPGRMAAELAEVASQIDGIGDVTMEVANKLYPQNGYQFVDAYLDLMTDASLEWVDYVADPEAVRKLINTWVEQKTQDKIVGLIGPNVLGRLTRLVLVNAIYFKGDWACQFDKGLTKPLPFYAPTGRIEVPTMYQNQKFGYTEGNGYQAVRLPYVGNGRLAMLVILPRVGQELVELMNGFDARSFDRLIRELEWAEPREVNLWLPRWKITWGTEELVPIFQQLGVVEAFGPNADFSGMTTTNDLFISNILHKAFVAVDEEGTEAAAATAVVMSRKCASVPMPPVDFQADHPFAFVIMDSTTNEVLFMGRVEDPTK